MRKLIVVFIAIALLLCACSQGSGDDNTVTRGKNDTFMENSKNGSDQLEQDRVVTDNTKTVLGNNAVAPSTNDIVATEAVNTTDNNDEALVTSSEENADSVHTATDTPMSDANDSIQGQRIEATTSEDPELGFWIALQCETNIMTVGTPFAINIGFGTEVRSPEYFDVIIESEDFEIVKSCPDRYFVNDEAYSASDFFTSYPEEHTFENLPQKFGMTLTKSEEKELYCGEITVEIVEYTIGGYGTASITLYYYGNSDVIFFSVSSQQDAENNFYSFEPKTLR